MMLIWFKKPMLELELWEKKVNKPRMPQMWQYQDLLFSNPSWWNMGEFLTIEIPNWSSSFFIKIFFSQSPKFSLLTPIFSQDKIYGMTGTCLFTTNFSLHSTLLLFLLPILILTKRQIIILPIISLKVIFISLVKRISISPLRNFLTG